MKNTSAVSKDVLVDIVTDLVPPGQAVNFQSEFLSLRLKSLDYIHLYGEVQSRFGVRFSIEEVQDLSNIDELYAFILDRQRNES